MSSDYDPNYVPKKTFFRVGCKAIITDFEEKILILKRSDKTGGQWSFPGGALDDNESPEQGISREIFEELQIKATNFKPFAFNYYHNESNENIIIIGFTVKYDNQEIKLNWEHDEYRWLTKEEVLKLDLTSDGKTFLQKYIELFPS